MQTFGKQYLRLLLVVVWRLACYSFMDTGRGLNTSESETKDVIYFEAVSIWSFIITLPPPPAKSHPWDLRREAQVNGIHAVGLPCT